MIETLFIQNLKLVEQTTVYFGPCLNILTGETGSGKSAILSAIRLILGERADLSQIRHEKELAIVEAKMKGVIIRREIHRSGKTRSFINDEVVSLTELRSYVKDKICIIDQGLAFELKNQEMQQNILDEYAGSSPLLQKIEAKKKEKQEKTKELLELQEKKKILSLDHLKNQWQTIEDVSWKEGEEERLLEEHHTLLHAQEIQEQISKALAFLGSEERPLALFLKKLSKEKHLPSESQKLLASAAVEMEEAEQILTSHLAAVEASPDKLQQTETRIGQIEELKKRFRVKTYEELTKKKAELSCLLDQAENIDALIASLTQKLFLIEQEITLLKQDLFTLRSKAAATFTYAILQELSYLNLPNATLFVDIQDSVSFRFSANPGHPPLPLSDVGSGGELSRLLFAIKTLQYQNPIPSSPSCPIFDEIDSNVGGTTASLLGQKLTQLSSHCQLICVTHFVQVAKRALHHFRVYKEPFGAQTVTQIEPLLTSAAREIEYTRMLGLERKPVNSLP